MARLTDAIVCMTISRGADMNRSTLFGEPYLLCSECFSDVGLRLESRRWGRKRKKRCKNCGQSDGFHLTRNAIEHLCHAFFVRGSMLRCDYGAAPVIQFNCSHETDVDSTLFCASDMDLLRKAIGAGFFFYGPRMWMVGEIEPLKDLQEEATRGAIIERILKEYPTLELSPEMRFFKIRKNPEAAHEPLQYDSAPDPFLGTSRFDSPGFPVLYSSPDLEVCIHECRVAAEDELFVATMQGTKTLKLLDLSEVLEEDVTEFESLDLAVHMLFLAGSHSYPLSREIAKTARAKGFDGLVYPSHFSLLRTGAIPFETTYGISHRRIRQLKPHEQSKVIPNLAIFGRPIEESIVAVECINRIVLRSVTYDVHFGPVLIPRPAGQLEAEMEALIARLEERANAIEVSDG